ncbi:MAG: Hsp20/alpha crystallin family protein [Steroidobacteraceae bacterium]|jgi:HSP20 family protein
MSAQSGGMWMWSQACAVLEEAERRHRRFFELLSVPARRPVWEPPIDVFLLERELHIVVALPGVRPSSVSVELSSSHLWVRAESQPPVQMGRARIVRLEIAYGRIERRIDLPAGRYQLLGHEFADGCLHVRVGGEPA